MRVPAKKFALILLLGTLGPGLVCCVLPMLFFAALCRPDPPITVPSPDGLYSVQVSQIAGCYMESTLWRVAIVAQGDRAILYEVFGPQVLDVEWTDLRELRIEPDPGGPPQMCVFRERHEQWRDVRVSYQGRICQSERAAVTVLPESGAQ
jgi:hypothetical protein